MRKSNDQPLKEVIEQMLDAYKIRGKINEVRLLQAWEKLMGLAVRNRTSEIYISGRKLFVRLNSSVLREELSYGKEKMKTMLNEEAGAPVIDEVVLL
jgi:hypothetical protein